MGDYNGWANRPTWALYTGITSYETELKRVRGWFSQAAAQRLTYDDAVDLAAAQRLTYDDAVDLAAERLEDEVYDLYDRALYQASPVIRDMLIHPPNETAVDYERIVTMIVGKNDYEKLLPASARQSDACIRKRQKHAHQPAQSNQERKSKPRGVEGQLTCKPKGSADRRH